MHQQPRLSLNAAAWFFVRQSDHDGAEQSVPIVTPFRVGRHADSDLQLPCSSVSGSHAEIIERNGELWLNDLNSTNGTFINGRRIESNNRLCEDDTVQFGTVVFHITRDCESNTEEGVPSEQESADVVVMQNERLERLFCGDIVPFFQPIISLKGGDRTIVGYEVLGRSRLFGLRTPAQMFAAASRMEMEAELSRVLRKKGIHVADSGLPEHFSLFVNTHPAELECDGMEESLYEIREHHPSRPIVMEVHESILNNAHKFVGLRSTLQNLDIQLAFHDFGASQIRLAEIFDFVPDVVKFDVKLIQRIDQAPKKKQDFVASMVSLMTNLGITPLAECIEQSNECATLQQLGFELGQGFLFGRPTSIVDCSNSVVDRAAVKSEPGLTQERNSQERNSQERNSQERNSQERNSTPEVMTFLDRTAPQLAMNETFEEAQVKDADWLLSQPGHFYTIQVLSAISMERAQEHIATQNDPEQFAIFCKRGKTRILYIVVYGVFEDRSAAKAASAILADASVSPWIRMLSSVHGEIRTDK